MVNTTNTLTRIKLLVIPMTLLLYSLLFTMPSDCHAGDKKIHVQGRLTDAGGTALDGSQLMTFRLYETDTGGASVWTSAASAVQVTDGQFHAVLQNGTPSLDQVPFNKTYYLSIEVGEQEITTRQVMGAAGTALGSIGDFDVKDNLYMTGSIGVGTTNPSSQLHIEGASNVTNRAISIEVDYMNDGAENTIDFLDAGEVVGRMGVVRNVASPTSFDFFIGNLWQGSPQTTKSFYVQGGGNIGIGTTGPTGLLELHKNVGDYDTAGCDLIFNPIQNGAIGYAPKAKISGQVTNGDSNIGKISFYTSNSVKTLVERMVIDEGNVGIGISNPTERLYVAGNIYCTGQYLPSDIILKTGIETLPMDTLSRVMKLNGVKYKWDMAKIREKGWLKDRAKVIKKIKARGTTPEEQRAMKEKMLADLKKQEQEWEKPQIGLIAQEIEAQFPELVKTYEDDSKAIDYAKFTAVLLEAVKQLKGEVEHLRTLIKKENKAKP